MDLILYHESEAYDDGVDASIALAVDCTDLRDLLRQELAGNTIQFDFWDTRT